MDKRDAKRMRQECWHCQHRRNVPGNAHITCANPDPDMIGSQHGIDNGWFYYPLLFDPTWKEKLCCNFAEASQTTNKTSDQSSDQPNTANVQG